METITLRLVGITLVGVTSALALKKSSPIIGMMAAFAAGIVLIFEAARFFSPLAELFSRLQSVSGVNSNLFAPLVKVALISVASRITGEICRDSSQDALAEVLETVSVIISLAVAAPVFLALFEIVGRYI